jgi:hypothetical protein
MERKGLIGFKDLTPEQVKIAKEIHERARSMEYINNSGYAHPRIAMIEELTKEPTSIEYMIEKMQMLFDIKLKVEKVVC